MMRNYYYLIAGILAVLFSVTHAWNGQAVVLPTLHVDAVPADVRTTFFYVWHIITAENLIFGLVFLFMAFHAQPAKIRFTAWAIVFLLLVRWLVLIGSTIALNPSGLKDTLVDSIAIVVYIVLILLGIRVKDKQLLTREQTDNGAK